MRWPWMAPWGIVGLLVVTSAAGQSTDATKRVEAPTPTHSSSSATGQAASADPADPWSATDVAPAMDDAVVKRPAAKLTSATGEATPKVYGWLRTSASLAGVIALIVLLAWGYRLVTGGGARLSAVSRARHPGLIEVISRANLGARQTLHLVRVGTQLILIGATHDALRTLSVIEDPDLAARLAGAHAHQQNASGSAAFQSCLEKEARDYEDGPAEGKHRHTGNLPGIRQKLGEAVRRLQNAVPPT